MIYQALHEQLPDLPTGVPQAYIDRYVLVGSDQIPRELPAIVDHCLATGGCDWPFTFEPANAPAEPVETASAQPVYLAYCYNSSCLECDRVNYDLAYLEEQFPFLHIQRFDVAEDAALIEAMCTRYGVPPEERLRAPALFIADQYIGPEDINVSYLSNLIQPLSQTGTRRTLGRAGYRSARFCQRTNRGALCRFQRIDRYPGGLAGRCKSLRLHNDHFLCVLPGTYRSQGQSNPVCRRRVYPGRFPDLSRAWPGAFDGVGPTWRRQPDRTYHLRPYSAALSGAGRAEPVGLL